MKLRTRFENKGRANRQADAEANAQPEPKKVRLGSAPSHAAKNLALAHHIERLIDRGVIADYTAAAQALGVSQPRVTQIMSVLFLAPAIQEQILLGEIAPSDKELRQLARVVGWDEQEARVRRR